MRNATQAAPASRSIQLSACILAAVVLPGTLRAGRPVDYATEIQPLFNATCGGGNCHIGRRTSGVDLTNYRATIESVGDLYGRLVVLPPDSAASPLLDKVSRQYPELGLRMPPSGRGLSPDQVALVADWIDGGATETVTLPRRGDMDLDGELNITDAISLLGFLFLGSASPLCAPVADANADGEVNISDPVNILSFLFLGAAKLPELRLEEARDCVVVNYSPRVPPLRVYRTHPGLPVEFSIGATDPDGDSLLYEALSLPPGASLDPASGLVRWLPHDLGPFYLPFIVSDDGKPQASILRTQAFQVLPLDPCSVPDCDPATGCEETLLALGMDCCGSPAERVAEPLADCPGGAVLYVGRNSLGFGRIQNCDRMQAVSLGQGGYQVRFHLEARCIRPESVMVRSRLETPFDVLFDRTDSLAFQPGDDGFVQAFGNTYSTRAGALVSDNLEADLTVSVRDVAGVSIEKKLRVVLTFLTPPDLP
jgi:hypothetical protein